MAMNWFSQALSGPQPGGEQSGFQLSAPQMGEAAPLPSYLGGYGSQLSLGSGGATAPSTDYSSLIGAGIGAGGQTIGTIAQIMAQQAARQQTLQQNSLNNASTEQIAKMQIAGQAAMNDKSRREAAQQFLLQMLGNQASGAMNAWDTQRAANKQGSSLTAQAYYR